MPVPPVRSSRRCALARRSRVFTVFSGMPSRRPASRVVRPSRTVAWTTARISGDSRSSAVPRSPYSTPRRTLSSALGSGCGQPSTSSDGSASASRWPRNRDTSRRMAIPQSQAATSPSPASVRLPSRRARKVSWRTSATASGGLHRRLSRAASHGAAGRRAAAAQRGPRRPPRPAVRDHPRRVLRAHLNCRPGPKRFRSWRADSVELQPWTTPLSPHCRDEASAPKEPLCRG